MISKPIRITILVFSIIFALGIFGFFSIPYFFENVIKIEVGNIIKSSFKEKAQFKNIKISPFSDLPYLSIILDSIVLSDSTFNKPDTLFKANQISFSISLKDWLFDHKYIVNKVYFDTPKGNVKKSKNGDNYSFLLQKDTITTPNDTSKFNFKISSIIVKNGYLSFRDLTEKTTVIAEKINIDGAMDISNDYQNLRISFNTDDFVYKYKNFTYLYKNTISADLILDYNKEENSITFNDHFIQIDYFKFGFIGFAILKNDTTSLDVQFKTEESNIKNLISLIPGIYKEEYEKYNASGKFTLEGEIKGQLNAKHKLSPSYFAHFKLKDGEFQYNDLPKPISDIAIDLKFEKLSSNDEPTFILNELKAKLDSNYIDAVMTVVGTDKPFMVGNVNATIELHELDQYFKVDSIAMAGHLMANVTVNGVMDKEIGKFPQMKGKLLLSKGYFKRQNIEHEMKNIEMETYLTNETGYVENTSMKLSKLNFIIGDEYVEMYGKMEDFKKYNFDLFLKSAIDLQKLNDLAKLETITMSGIVNTKIIAKGSAEKFKEAYISGTANLKDVHIEDRETQLDLYVKNGNMVFSPEMVLLSNFDMKVFNESFRVNGLIKNLIPFIFHEKAALTANIRINADSLNLNNFMAKSSNKTATKIDTTKLETKKSNDQTSTFAALNNINLDMKLTAKKLNFDIYQLYNVNAAFKASDKLIKIEKSSFNSLDAKFQIPNGQITPNSFAMTLDIDKIDTRKVMQLLYPVKPDSNAVVDETGAILDINYELKGELDSELKPLMKSLNGYGLISVENANIKGMKVLSHISKISGHDDLHKQDLHNALIITEIKGGKVHIKPFTINLGKYLTNFEGTHSFDNEISYFVKLGIPPFQKIPIPLHIKGTLDKPEVTLANKKK